MDTRTPNRPPWGRGAEDSDGGPGLYTVKVPTDPARLSSTTASFRVRLGASTSPLIDARTAAPAFAGAAAYPGVRPLAPFGLAPDTTQPMALPTLVGAAVGGQQGSTAAPRRRPRVTPITWTGGADPLLDAVRLGGTGTVPSQQTGSPSGQDLGQDWSEDTRMMPAVGSTGGYPDPYDEVAYVDGREPRYAAPEYQLSEREAGDPLRHAWYPARRVDLGLVLLPLRIFLGGISVYAGFVKLCDPVYFNGGARGSMMQWLQSLHPWPMAQPLLQLALTHPVGAGLGVAFVQIVVGVLSVLGLWQRVAAGTAMLLALALLLTVSWRSVPAYDAPEIIYLAAWSPLLLAGAPLFSLDGRLALEAWHRLGERARVSALRRRVLRRGFVVATVVIGGTLLLGSAVGAAVRGTQPVQTVQPSTPGLPTDYPAPIYPSGHAPAKAPAKPKHAPKPAASSTPGASPTHHATTTAPRHTGSGATHSGGGSTPGNASTGGGGTGSKSTSPHTPPAGGGGNGKVIGGLLGSGAPLPLLGMSAGGTAAGQPVT
ncbi:DoxX family protein [Streptacidiphilus cavernicola]|uniref:DoxX family protein n=1 Tax=Streptacidiphilus cavernicola TaxID=3342716 RepID=A0ABV6W259_9ACTN